MNSATGAKLWSYATGGGVRSSPAVVDDVAYFGSGDGNVYALNTRNGTKLWSYSAGAAGIDPHPTHPDDCPSG